MRGGALVGPMSGMLGLRLHPQEYPPSAPTKSRAKKHFAVGSATVRQFVGGRVRGGGANHQCIML